MTDQRLLSVGAASVAAFLYGIAVAAPGPTRAEPPQMPQDQVAFLELVEGFIEPYRAAPNELKKSALRKERQAALKKHTKSLTFKGWVGSIESMSTTNSGDALVEIRLGNSKVSVTNLAFKSMFSDIEIKHGSTLYKAFAELQKGDVVVVSGKFLPHPQDHIMEASLTELGSMTAPEFVVQYSAASSFAPSSAAGPSP